MPLYTTPFNTGKLSSRGQQNPRSPFGISDSVPAPLRLLIIAGQSNAQGLGVAASVSNYPGITDAVPAIQYYERTSNNAADPPNFTTEGPRDLAPRLITVGGMLAGTFGPELTIGRVLEASGDPWCIAKWCISGAGLQDHFWNAAYPTTPPAVFDQLVTFITAQLAAFGAAEVGGFVWVQGEADVNGIPDEANYKANLEAMFTSLRSTFGNFPIVINRVTNKYAPVAGVSAMPGIQNAFAESFSDVGIVYGDDLPMRDAVHYGDNGYTTLGTRLGEKLLEVRAGLTPTSPRWYAAGPCVVANSIQTLTVPWPVGHQSGDRAFLILGGVGINAYTLSTPAGFTALTSSPQWAGVGTNSRLHVWECVASSGSQASPVIGDVASDDSKMAVMIVVRGGSALNVAAGSNTGTGSTSLTAPSVTTTVPNTLVLNIVTHEVDFSTAQFSGWTNANLTGLTEHTNISTTTGGGCGIGVAVGYKATAGATGTTAVTAANSTTSAAITIAIAP